MWRWLVVLATACNQVYDLQPTRARDAGALVDPDDEDADGVADALDNCPKLGNVDQADVDGDSTGDVCDDCALVPNEQAADADGDGLGDLCDPHPSLEGDCVLLVDTFADATKFDDGWKHAGAGTITPRPGNLYLEPIQDQPPIVLRPAVGSGATDMFVRGTTDAKTAGVAAIVSANQATEPYSCLLSDLGVSVDGPLTSVATTGKLVPEATVTLAFVSRVLTNLRTDGEVDVFCRADYGVSVATAVSRGEPLVIGEPEIVVSARPVTLDAVVLLRFQPGKTCPVTIYR
jgi:Thrombospondin type 3 repeat